jgi:hypothetical protein
VAIGKTYARANMFLCQRESPSHLCARHQSPPSAFYFYWWQPDFGTSLPMVRFSPDHAGYRVLSDIRADLLTARAARKSAAPCVVRGQARRPLKAQRASACASSDRIVNARKEPGFNAGGPSKPGSQIDSHERLQRQAPIPALSERKRRQMPIVSSQFCRNSGSRCWFCSRDINGRPSWALDEAHYSGYSAFHCRSSYCCSGTPRR